MVEGKDYSDSQILAATTQSTDAKGNIQFRTGMPSGRVLTSEWMPPDQVSGKVTISWCEHVRQQIDVDVREAAAIRKRGSITIVDSPRPDDSVPDDEPDALKYAKAERDKLQEAVNKLEKAINEYKETRETKRLALEQWQKVVDVLRGENDD